MSSWSLPRNLLAFAGHFAKPANASLPDIVPFDRPQAEVKSAGCYEHDAIVWAYIGGVWRHARVIEGAEAWVLVRYLTPGIRDIAIEAVTPRCVMDPY